MRNFLILLFSINFLISCNSDDDNTNTQQSNNFFNPPSWIHGKWLVDDSNMIFGFEFTDDNFIILQSGANINYGEILEMQEGMGVNVNTIENISNTKYKVEIVIQGTSTTYNFEKVTPTIIEHLNTNFYKQ